MARLKSYTVYETSAWDGNKLEARRRASEVLADVKKKGIWRGRKVERATLLREDTRYYPKYKVIIFSRT